MAYAAKGGVSAEGSEKYVYAVGMWVNVSQSFWWTGGSLGYSVAESGERRREVGRSRWWG